MLQQTVEAPTNLSEPLPFTAEPTDTELVQRARGGDGFACEQLAKLHSQYAYVHALRLMGDREDALDVTQDAMLRFFSNLHRFDAGRPVRPWLFQIVRNRALDLHRRRRVLRQESLDEIHIEALLHLKNHTTAVDPEQALVDNQQRRQVLRALRALPRHHRQIVVLRDFQELSYAEIAERLVIPLGSVMSRLHFARRRLRELCEGYWRRSVIDPPRRYWLG